MSDNYDYEIDEWAVVGSNNPYLPPEASEVAICGKCLKRAQELGAEDGDVITTSPVVAFENGIVETKSGSRYKLLTPNKEYVAWCESRGKDLFKILSLEKPDPEKPQKWEDLGIADPTKEE